MDKRYKHLTIVNKIFSEEFIPFLRNVVNITQVTISDFSKHYKDNDKIFIDNYTTNNDSLNVLNKMFILNLENDFSLNIQDYNIKDKFLNTDYKPLRQRKLEFLRAKIGRNLNFLTLNIDIKIIYLFNGKMEEFEEKMVFKVAEIKEKNNFVFSQINQYLTDFYNQYKAENISNFNDIFTQYNKELGEIQEKINMLILNENSPILPLKSTKNKYDCALIRK